MRRGRLRVGRGALLGRAAELLPAAGRTLDGARLQARTGAAEFDFVRGGAVITRRLDVLVGGASRGAPGLRACGGGPTCLGAGAALAAAV